MKNLIVAAIFGVFLLSSCTAPTENSNASKTSHSAPENKTAEAVSPTKNKPASNKLDTCKVLPKGEVERILGRGVESAELSLMTEGTESTAAFSQCRYRIDDGRTVEVFARRSPVADKTPDAIQKVRDTMTGIGKPEDVAGVGDSAFWIPGINQLHVFKGENVYLFLTMKGFKNSGEAKAKSGELAIQTSKGLSD